jgi:tetratricopeptide (TPR) repeat protein
MLMDLGGRLKQLRLQRGMTQTELATPSYTAAYVSTIEAGRRQPSRAALEFFADKLGVDAEELRTGRTPDLHLRLLAEFGECRRVLASGVEDDSAGAEKRLRKLRSEATRLGFSDVATKASLALGLASELRNDLDEALSQYEGLEHELRDASPLSRVDVVVARARVLQSRGEIALAAFLIEKLLAELETSGLDDPSSLCRLHTSLVAAYFDRGLVDQANASAEIALSLSQEVEDPERLANMNLNVAIALWRQEQWQEAEKRFAEAERWFDQLNFRTDLARVQMARGMSLRGQGALDESVRHLNHALVILQEAGQTLNQARATCELATTERLAGNLDQARLLLRGAISLAGEESSTAGIAYREMALCESDERAKAIDNLRRSITVLEKTGPAKELAATYRAFGDLLSGDDSLLAACEAYKKAAELFEVA